MTLTRTDEISTPTRQFRRLLIADQRPQRAPARARRLSLQVGIYTFLSLCLVASAPPLAAESLDDLPVHDFQLRTVDPRIRQWLDDGIKRSATFRMLVERLKQSDIVVYLQADNRPLHGVDGRLTFVGAHAGVRYVLVRLRMQSSPCRQVAIIGHELQHAVEVADAPEIVDAASLAKAYSRFGYASGWASRRGTTFDTRAAVQAGYDVLKEVLDDGMSAE
jgi:hypothetical protein